MRFPPSTKSPIRNSGWREWGDPRRRPPSRGRPDSTGIGSRCPQRCRQALLAWAVSDRPAATAITIDHGLPGSAALVAAAISIAKLLGMPHRVVVVHPRSASEGDLREVRLCALEEVSEDWILLGHTADDQAETVLGNLLRGAGTRGLSGIRPQRDRFVRPLSR